MVVTILAEPRSGSTNLTNWFYFNKNFTTLFIPSNPESRWYKPESPKEYKYNTEHLLVKEDYCHYKNFDELISVSDKIILLYRENVEEQIESWINAKSTNDWHSYWIKTEIKNDNEKEFFLELKKSFKENYLNNEKYFKISYEELYYNNGFEKIVTYLNIGEVKNIKFPIGNKYRIYVNKTKTLI